MPGSIKRTPHSIKKINGNFDFEELSGAVRSPKVQFEEVKTTEKSFSAKVVFESRPPSTQKAVWEFFHTLDY